MLPVIRPIKSIAVLSARVTNSTITHTFIMFNSVVYSPLTTAVPSANALSASRPPMALNSPPCTLSVCSMLLTAYSAPIAESIMSNHSSTANIANMNAR